VAIFPRKNHSLSLPLAVAEKFKLGGDIVGLREYGAGNINDTYLVTAAAGKETKFILQCINRRVFPQPEKIMRNTRLVTEHIRKRLANEQKIADRRWEVPRVFQTKGGEDYFIDANGDFWRALGFIDHALTYKKIKSAKHGKEIGHALGIFHNLIGDLPAGRLVQTLDGFHITPQYINRLESLKCKGNRSGKTPATRFCFKFIKRRQAFADILESAKKQKILHIRPIHGDPKVDNVMIDTGTDRAVGLIDLDTVQPGLVHYDLGDCLRSCCNTAGEEIDTPADVRFDTDLCRIILAGYLAEAANFLTYFDYQYLYDAIRLISFELGIRFFTDYLQGNPYFKVMDDEHNLRRALVQFKLTEDIEAQESLLRALIAELTPAGPRS